MVMVSFERLQGAGLHSLNKLLSLWTHPPYGHGGTGYRPAPGEDEELGNPVV